MNTENLNRRSQMLLVMLNLQDSLNSMITADWRSQNRKWYRAIWTESAENMGHIGWKWWKNEELNVRQAQIEMVDILHFGLSSLLQKYRNVEEIISRQDVVDSIMDFGSIKKDIHKEEILSATEDLVLHVLRSHEFCEDTRASFVSICSMIGLSPELMFTSYIGKNALNAFRQNNGYKAKGESEYIKFWHGEEDNVWLERSLDKHKDAQPSAIYDLVMADLQEVYNTVKNTSN